MSILNKDETFYSINPKLNIGLFADLDEFTCFYQFLPNVIIKLFADQNSHFMNF